jgi:hypothetical protein
MRRRSFTARKCAGSPGFPCPYYGQPPVPVTHIIKAVFTDQGRFFYQAYFQDEGRG